MNDGEAAEAAERCLYLPHKHCDADDEIERVLRQIADGDSLVEVMEDQVVSAGFLKELLRRDFEKSRETSKHYIDSAKQPSPRPKSKMGHPKRGADGRILRDASGRVIWETDEEVKKVPANVRADGVIDTTKSIMGNPVRQADGSIKWVVK